MLRTINQWDRNFDAKLNSLLNRDEALDSKVEETVKTIVSEVRCCGDDALLSFTEQFDRVSVDSVANLEILRDEIDGALQSLPKELQIALIDAANRIHHYHQQEVLRSWQFKSSDGTLLGQKITPLGRVGIYVPGGKAAYPSSVLMTVLPAKVAGVREIIMVVPTPNGNINHSIIAAAGLSGVDRIFRIGGAQAVAALAYGTKTIPAVDKIVGPGNIYVTTAKKQVFGKVGIDMLAGPSEIVVICDQSANPDWVAIDLLAQSEHDELAQSIAITDSLEMAEKINASISRLLPEMKRKSIIEKSLTAQGAIIIAESLYGAVELSNIIAPEHVALMVERPNVLEEKIQNAGAILVGNNSTESFADYCAGPNHVLPTAGTARFSSPLGVYDYQKRSSLIEVSQKGANTMARIASVLARCEGLTAHACSAEYRSSI